MIYPAQEPIPAIENAPIPPFVIDNAQYQADEFYPPQIVEMEEPIIIRGCSTTMLRIYPIQFNPTRKTLRTYSHIQVRVSFQGGEGYFIKERLLSSSFNTMFNNLFPNGPSGYFSVGLGAAFDYGNSLLIITHPRFLEAAQTLSEWKIKKGIETVVTTTDNIFATIPGSPTAEEIQTYIKNAYDNWPWPPTHLLLIGDAEFIPCHYETYHNYDKCYIGTDLYYATVDGKDYFPDISIGRLSVDTLSEANKRIQDIISYEKASVHGEDFYTHVACIGEFEDEIPKTEPDQIEDWCFIFTLENIRDFLINSGSSVDRIYYASSNIDPKYYASFSANRFLNKTLSLEERELPQELQRPHFPWDGGVEHISDAVNSGRFLVIYNSHGSKTCWGRPFYYKSNVKKLKNGSKLPVVWSLACQTGWFDTETDNATTYNPQSTCFSEAWERNPNGGAVGVIASTRVSYICSNARLLFGWMDALWPNFDPNYPQSRTYIEDPQFEMGQVLTYGKLNYFSRYKEPSYYTLLHFEVYHWFGDPTMQIWTDVPQELNVSHELVIAEGTTFIEVTVDKPGTLICISKDNKILSKAISGYGPTFLPLAPPSQVGDVINVTVTKHNFRPYEGIVKCILAKKIYYVDADGGKDFNSIQEAIDSADNDSHIIAYPGTYRERIHFRGDKTITLQGIEPTQWKVVKKTIIDGNKEGVVVQFTNGDKSTLEGITIQNGQGKDGGGIICINSSPKISRCLIRDNRAYDPDSTAVTSGGGISCFDNSEPKVLNCRIKNNRAGNGGGIHCEGSAPIISKCNISGNKAVAVGGGGIRCSNGSHPTIKNCLIRDNSAVKHGAGISCASNSSPEIYFCDIIRNSSFLENGCGGIAHFKDCQPIVNNSVIWDNQKGDNSPFNIKGDTFTIKHCNIQDDDQSDDYRDPTNKNIYDINPLYRSENPSPPLQPKPTKSGKKLKESPCVDQGICIPEINMDKFGTKRPKHGNEEREIDCDIGVHEYWVSSFTSINMIFPLPKFFDHTGGIGTIEVDLQDEFIWEAYTNDSWIIINSDHSGCEEVVVSYEVLENQGEYRQGTIFIYNLDENQEPLIYTIGQNGYCTYSLVSYRNDFDYVGGFDNVQVITPNGCVWTATSNEDWIKISPSTGGSGVETLHYEVLSNSGDARTGTMTIEGETFFVFQEGILETYYLDTDDDTYGDPNNSIQAVELPLGYVENYSDCDDNDPNVNPVEIEICDEKDNDCDGKIDEKDAKNCIIYFKDADKDGYGIDKDFLCLCAPKGIYTAIQAGDPDDLDPDEIPGDLITIDCHLSNGWNMISLPVIQESLRVSDLFPQAVVIYGYEKGIGYVRVKKDEDLETGKGYWILINDAQTFILTGQSIQEYTLSVDGDGWYMIGGCISEAKASVDNGKIKVIYRYTQGVGYQRVLESESLMSGEGYWILLQNVIDQTRLKIETK